MNGSCALLLLAIDELKEKKQLLEKVELRQNKNMRKDRSTSELKLAAIANTDDECLLAEPLLKHSHIE